jgi:hypothetical protein
VVKLIRAAVLAVALALTACAASVKKSNIDGAPLTLAPEQSKRIVMYVTGSPEALANPEWQRLGAEWRKSAGVVGGRMAIEFSVQDDASPRKEPGVLVTVDVKRFRFVAPGSRGALGIVAGNAFLDLEVKYADLQTGAPLGVRKYDSRTKTSQGVFAAVTSKQVEAICDDIAHEVTQR